ncbi:MAG: MerR family transcriptional regulator [Phycisphaerae bacterium]|nr:MerR family transcriptional regulator [Phycisphaerae bacterium]
MAIARKKATDPKLMRISAAAKAAGVSKQTVEYYIMLGLVSPLRRQGGGGRFFDAELVKRIRLIRRLNESGYTLRAIRETYLHGR